MATQFSILAWRILMDRGAWQAAVHRVRELDMTEAMSMLMHTGDLLTSYFCIPVPYNEKEFFFGC